MKETSSVLMPPCFERFCQKLDSALKTTAQKRELRHYLAGLLGVSEQKNINQIANNNGKIAYHKLHHFMTDSPWSYSKINDRRLEIISQCRQTKIAQKFSLILDDSESARKSVNFIDSIGKTDHSNMIVTTHVYDGIRSYPLDLEIYDQADNLLDGKEDQQFKKKSKIAIELVEKCLNRNLIPSIILIEDSYEDNGYFLNELEKKKLIYIGAIAKNSKVKLIKEKKLLGRKRLDEIAKSLNKKDFKIVESNQKKFWVALVKAKINQLSGLKTIAIIINAYSLDKATKIDYLITNEKEEKITVEWIIKKYSERNCVAIFFLEVKERLGLSEFQLRNKESLMKHFILVFCAYTFIEYHKLTGGLRRRWASKPLKTFRDALETFRTTLSFHVMKCLNNNGNVFMAFKKGLGFSWCLFLFKKLHYFDSKKISM